MLCSAPAALLGRQRLLNMESPKPLSVKFDPAVRERIKRISCLLDWPEGQFVNACAAIVLEMIEDRSLGHMHKTIYLAQQALDFDKAQFKLTSAPHSSRKKVLPG